MSDIQYNVTFHTTYKKFLMHKHYKITKDVTYLLDNICNSTLYHLYSWINVIELTYINVNKVTSIIPLLFQKNHDFVENIQRYVIQKMDVYEKNKKLNTFRDFKLKPHMNHYTKTHLSIAKIKKWIGSYDHRFSKKAIICIALILEYVIHDIIHQSTTQAIMDSTVIIKIPHVIESLKKTIPYNILYKNIMTSYTNFE